VTFYDNALMGRWMHWLNENVCGELLGVDPLREEPYVNCFALDPCRCDDEEFLANRGGDLDQNGCYAEIGFCDGIEGDEEAVATCRQNILDRTGMEADTLIFGTTMANDYPDDPDRTEGVYELAGLPTNLRLVVKVSGRISRWRDTYEYGLILERSEVDGEGRRTLDVNVITDGAWQTIPSSAGIAEPIPPEHGAVAGRVYDCGIEDGRGPGSLLGARVGFVQDAEKIAYFNGVASDTLPLPGQAYTNRDGVYAAIDVGAGPNRVAVLAMQDGEMVGAGVRDVYMLPYSVIIATFEGDWVY
jgi:hypothetical protein